jgi:hypothetical protein
MHIHDEFPAGGFMKFILIASMALLPTSALAQTAPTAQVAQVPELGTASTQWRAVNVVAAQSFDRWVQQDSEAQAVVAFTIAHPGRTKMLIDWALQNPFGDLNGFNEVSKGLASELTKSPTGTANLLSWARQNAGSARYVLSSPYGFKLLAQQQ